MTTTITVAAGDGQDIAVGRDATGNPTITLTPASRADVRSATILGIDAPVTMYAPTYGGQFQSARIARVFSGPGEGIISWDDERYALLPPHVAPHGSFKDWPSDRRAVAMIKQHLDTMPDPLRGSPLLPELGVSYALTYLHEGENNGVAVTDYQHRYEVLYSTVKTHPMGPRVAVIPVQTLQWTQMRSSAGKPHGDGNIMTWWAGIGDFAGIDCYAAAANPYPDPAAFLELPLRLARATGRRLWVPELGTVRADDDPNGTKRAAWLASVLDRLTSYGCAAVSWWHGQDGNHDFHLDAAGAATWNRYAVTPE